jgi:hypothetical protein
MRFLQDRAKEDSSPAGEPIISALIQGLPDELRRVLSDLATSATVMTTSKGEIVISNKALSHEELTSIMNGMEEKDEEETWVSKVFTELAALMDNGEITTSSTAEDGQAALSLVGVTEEMYSEFAEFMSDAVLSTFKEVFTEKAVHKLLSDTDLLERFMGMFGVLFAAGMLYERGQHTDVPTTGQPTDSNNGAEQDGDPQPPEETGGYGKSSGDDQAPGSAE